MDRIEDGLFQVMRRGHVVCNAGGGRKLRRVFDGLERADQYRKQYRMGTTNLPNSQKLYEEVTRESRGEHLRDDEDV